MWCHSSKHFTELVPHHGRKVAGTDMVWRSYVTVIEITLLSCYALQEQQQQQQPFYGRLSGTTQVSQYQKKHSPTHHPDHHPIFISFFHLPRSIAYCLFKSRAWQSFCTTSLHVLFGLPLGLEPSASYSIRFFTQSVSSFRNTCPYHRNVFCCSINIISSVMFLISCNTYWQSVGWLCCIRKS